MEDLNPNALAIGVDDDEELRPGVQIASESMIYEYVHENYRLPHASALAFADWVYDVWYDFNEDGNFTNGQVIEAAVTEWCGGRTL